MKKLAMLLVAAAICCGATTATAETKQTQKVQCTATTKAGAQCKRNAVDGTKLCTIHTPVQPSERCQAKTKSGEQCKRRHNQNGKFCTQHQKA